MDKGDIIKVEVPNGVEVKAVILDIIEKELSENIWSITYILYAQNRLFKAMNMLIIEEYIDEETNKPIKNLRYTELNYIGILVDYCTIPEYDNL